MAPRLIDTHCHLDAETFQHERDAVIARAVEGDVSHLLTIGIDQGTSQAAVAIAEQYECVSAVVGIQPNYVHEVKPDDWESILSLIDHPKVVGVGETGLDKYWDHAPLDLQREYFHRHIRLSRERKLPFVVHCREAESDVLDVLRTEAEHGSLHGVMHSFCGDAETAAECVELGMHVSFSGMTTFRKNEKLRAVASTVPLDRILVETDAPYLAPHPNRSKRNEPAWVRLTAECLAQVYGISDQEFANTTTRNAEILFGLR
ncbi:MAG: TatD family hydrolase [Fuerstiella sp.]|nr:TatD family hydrolase [Fuerstiella sp.]